GEVAADAALARPWVRVGVLPDDERRRRWRGEGASAAEPASPARRGTCRRLHAVLRQLAEVLHAPPLCLAVLLLCEHLLLLGFRQGSIRRTVPVRGAFCHPLALRPGVALGLVLALALLHHWAHRRGGRHGLPGAQRCPGRRWLERARVHPR